MTGDSSTVSGARVRRAARRAPARIHVVFPPELAASASFAEARIEVGRGAEAALRLDHPTVSRAHLAIERSAAGPWQARDLKSRNRSRLEGRALVEAARPLEDEAVIRVGDVLLVVETGPDAEDVEVDRDAIPGRSTAARRLRAAVARAAPDRAPALLVGETGTGKERIAGELHRLGGAGSLVAVNCAALAPQLVESQLFGHVRGAFTGATDAQPGLFRAAHGGTLFLDEIGDLPLDQQPKLLRAIEEGKVTPVGATRPVPVAVRVVCATHVDLNVSVEGGRFRRDLYARLSLWEIAVPPLRARRADLFDWLARIAAQRGRTVPALDADAAEALLLASWPSNLRGLDRLLRGLDGADEPIARADLPAWLSAASEAPARSEIPTREELVAAFAELGGSVHALARRFGRDRRQIYRWLEQHGLRSPA